MATPAHMEPRSTVDHMDGPHYQKNHNPAHRRFLRFVELKVKETEEQGLTIAIEESATEKTTKASGQRPIRPKPKAKAPPQMVNQWDQYEWEQVEAELLDEFG